MIQTGALKTALSPHSAGKSRSSEPFLLCHRAVTRWAKAPSKSNLKYSKLRIMKKMMTLRKSRRISVLRIKLQKQKRAPTALEKLLGWSRSWVSPSSEKLLKVTVNRRRRSSRSTTIYMIDLEKRGMNWSLCCIKGSSLSITIRSSQRQTLTSSKP